VLQAVKHGRISTATNSMERILVIVLKNPFFTVFPSFFQKSG
jgi:hypothetical protein